MGGTATDTGRIMSISSQGNSSAGMPIRETAVRSASAAPQVGPAKLATEPA